MGFCIAQIMFDLAEAMCSRKVISMVKELCSCRKRFETLIVINGIIVAPPK